MTAALLLYGVAVLGIAAMTFGAGGLVIAGHGDAADSAVAVGAVVTIGGALLATMTQIAVLLVGV